MIHIIDNRLIPPINFRKDKNKIRGFYNERKIIYYQNFIYYIIYYIKGGFLKYNWYLIPIF